MNKYGLEYVVDMDLSKCFDRLDHEWTKTKHKNQDETPYTSDGREQHQRRTGKRQALPRNDELLGNHLMEKIPAPLTAARGFDPAAAGSGRAGIAAW
ncbi:MAG: hypothetical protein ACYC0Q_05295 [Eubacteriales bacterium]|nr:hypothetical protein [Bacillota bacterium]